MNEFHGYPKNMILRNFLRFLCTIFVILFDFINRLCFRFFSYENTQVSDPKLHRQETETEKAEYSIVEYKHTHDEDESKVFSFEFQFPSYEEFIKEYTRNDNVGLISNYELIEFNRLENFSDSAENLEVEVYAGSNNPCFSSNEVIQHEGGEEPNLINGAITNMESENNLLNDFNFNQEYQLISENEALDFKSELYSVSDCEFPGNFVSSITGFLSETDFEHAFEHGAIARSNSVTREVIEEESTRNLDGFDEEHKKSHLQNPESPSSEMDRKKEEDFCSNDSKVPSEILSTPDPNKLKTLREHHELIKQLKTELKRVRAISLPTILEEDESQKIVEDFRPSKFIEKFRHVETMSELHKFHKNYSTIMRKFDSLNYQKMYAIGFLQSKDPLQAISSIDPSSPPFLHNFKLCKSKKKETDPTIKFMRELHTDLETVYVAQMCLSWEILHWQYEKALELCDSDPYGIRKYSKITGDEFQQFQVTIQRFLENEPFEGPRIQNYVKNHCVLRNLIQVPDITEDSMKDKRQARKNVRDENVISSDMLVEIMEESIRVFWRFVRTDKDAELVNRRGTRKGHIEPANLELFAEVQTCLQKKDKKVKDMLRSGNCILKKFQKREEDRSEQVLYFFSQVDMKLVARVLNMSRITRDQLLWCHNKLSKINFVNKKLNVKPTFSLFPC